MAARLIAEAGLDGVTIRDVADAADCSTAIVSHYFHNKRELLFLTYHFSIDRATERCMGALAGADGDLKAYLSQLMPLGEEQLIEWKIWLAFWAKAVADPEIAEVQRACILRTRAHILQIMNDLTASGALDPALDLAAEARRLLTLIIGLAVQVLFDPADWTAERQHALVDGELAKLYRPGWTPASISAPAPARQTAIGGSQRRVR